MSYVTASKFLDSFIAILKMNLLKKDQKLSNFGTFYCHTSKIRLGRNPMTKEEYIIQSITKTKFRASNHIKKTLN